MPASQPASPVPQPGPPPVTFSLTPRAIGIAACVLALAVLLFSFIGTLPKSNPAGLLDLSTHSPSLAPSAVLPGASATPAGKLADAQNEAAWAVITNANVEKACVYGLQQAAGASNARSCACVENATGTTKGYACSGSVTYSGVPLTVPVTIQCDKTVQVCSASAPGSPTQNYTFAQILQIAQPH